MYKLITFTLSLLVFLSCAVLPASALQLSPEGLTDLTGQITATTKLEVKKLAQTYQRDNGLVVYAAVVDNTENGLDDHRYIRQIFSDNLLSEKDTLILLDIGTRHVEIFSGEESKIYDSNVQAAIAAAKPDLIASNWDASIIKLVESIALAPAVNSTATIYFFVFLFVILILLSLGTSGSSSYSSGGYYSSGSDSGVGGGGGDSF